MTNSQDLQTARDFSLVLGGPLYQLYLRWRLARPPLELLWRRIVGISLLCWLPILVLSGFAGRLVGSVAIPFLFDVEVHVKLLGALPLLIGSEVIVHRRIPVIIGQFFGREIIAQEDRGKFDDLIASSLRLRNSTLVEVCLLLVVVTAGHWLWSGTLILSGTSWYGSPVNGRMQLEAGGYWYTFVSLPIFRFVLLRWYFRLFVWYRFLWRVRALPLHLNLFHPDRAAGLGFLSGSVFAFAPVLIAQTIATAGIILNQIWHAGATLVEFEVEIAGVVALLMFAVLGPLGFFIVQLAAARRAGLAELGTLASQYVDNFRRKWILDQSQPAFGQLLGTPDLQSLADLGSSYERVSDMRILPFGSRSVLHLAILVVAPLTPLVLTMIPLERVVETVLKLVL